MCGADGPASKFTHEVRIDTTRPMDSDKTPRSDAIPDLDLEDGARIGQRTLGLSTQPLRQRGAARVGAACA